MRLRCLVTGGGRRGSGPGVILSSYLTQITIIPQLSVALINSGIQPTTPVAIFSIKHLMLIQIFIHSKFD